MTTAQISSVVIAKLRELRQTQKVSAQKLSDQMGELGYPVARTVIANLEGGRRAEVSIDHVVIASKALGTTVTALLNEPVVCTGCQGRPPSGFTCNTCRSAGDAETPFIPRTERSYWAAIADALNAAESAGMTVDGTLTDRTAWSVARGDDGLWTVAGYDEEAAS